MPSLPPSFRLPPSGERGVALVLVLGFLVLITGLVLAFFSSVTTDLTSAKIYSGEAGSKELADTAVQLAIGSIRNATTTGQGIAWASQPGMIRTWDNTGAKIAYYKLYSSNNSVVTQSQIGSTTYDPIANPNVDLASVPTNASDWFNCPALFTDLNASVSATYGTIYPIINGNNLKSLTLGSNTYNTYLSGTNPMVDGFGILTSGANPVPVAAGASANPVPMPVRWIYVLKDGTLTVPASVDSTGKIASWAGAAASNPSAANPIVGRIAYWTDDETCKININTAAEGSYWDIPTFSTSEDVAFSQFQPGANEFNRYLGHPASTSLSPVFWSLYGLTDPTATLNALPNNPGGNYDTSGTETPALASYGLSYLKTIMGQWAGTTWTPGISPRYVWGASQAGTLTTLNGANAITSLDSDRLYANVDEMVFSPPSLSATSRPLNSGSLSASSLADFRFFLTANSRAPEVNPFNLPKVTMWPIPNYTQANPVNPKWPTTSGSISPRDSTIAFCSTLNNNPFYFTRYDPTSPTNDFTTSTRNQQVYNYVRNLLNQPVPGFGGQFSGGAKWNTLQTDQILTLAYDYIRSCINLVDSSAPGSTPSNPVFTYAYTTPPTVSGANINPNPGTGQVVPIQITNPSGNVTQGMGRFPTLRGATLQFIARSANQPPLMVYTSGPNLGCPALFNSAGAPLSVSPTTGNVMGADSPALTNVFAGTAYAQVNCMHPWNGIANGTTGNNKNILVVGNNQILVPQVMGKGGAVGLQPAFAADQTNLKLSPNNPIYLYPVFDLSAPVPTNGSPPTFTYPTLDTGSVNTTSTSGTNNDTTPPTVTVTTGTGNGLVDTTFSTASTFSGTMIVGATTYKYYLASYQSKPYPSWTSVPQSSPNVNPSTFKTHSGLPYLTVPRLSGSSVAGANQGAFDVPNTNFKDNVTLAPYQTRMEAILILDPATVAPGNVGLYPNCQFNVQNLNTFNANGTALGFPANATEYVLNGYNYVNPWRISYVSILGWPVTLGQGYVNNAPKPWQSMPFFANSKSAIVSGGNFAFTSGSPLQITIQAPTLPVPGYTAGIPVQTLNMNFPAATFPTPKLTNWWPTAEFGNYPPINATNDIVPPSYLTFDRTDTTLSPGGSRLSNLPGLRSYWEFNSTEMNLSSGMTGYAQGMNAITCDTFRSVEALYGDIRMIAPLANVPSGFFQENTYYGNLNPAYGQPFTVGTTGWQTYMRAAHSLRASDAVNVGATTGSLDDSTLLTGSLSYPIGAGAYLANGVKNSNNNGNGVGLSIGGSPVTNIATMDMSRGISAYNGTGDYTVFPNTTSSVNFGNSTFSNSGGNGIWQNGGDFDNGVSIYGDGPYINKPDEGSSEINGTFITSPYYSNATTFAGFSLYSPNRQVTSAVMFGSLPVGFGLMNSPSSPSPAMLNNSWQTLMFSPNPNADNVAGRNTRTAANQMTEAGAVPATPVCPDHLFLDFFHMPVVEPYPISEPFSTAGKVNMNYQIAPFNYITRSTAMRGVLKPVMLTAVNDQFVGDYKRRGGGDNGATFGDTTNPSAYPGGYNAFGSASNNLYFHYPVNVAQTLQQFDQRFANGDIFRSPSEICSLWLYPGTQPSTGNPSTSTALVTDTAPPNYTPTNIKTWWYASGSGDANRMGLTGDNERERPYASIYPRITTKSNSYTVHFRVQTLKKVPSTNATQWVEGQDQIVSEYRGSSLIERYVDPGDTTIPDFATSGTSTLDNYYKFRVVNSKRFAPQ
jgi:uncharacterized protein (TIGR02600 family)